MTILRDKRPKNQTVTRSNQLAPHRAIEVLTIEPGTEPGLLAVVSVKIGGIIIRGVRVTNRGRGTFVNFPSRKMGGEWVDLITITSPLLRKAVVDAILLAVRELDGVQ